MSADIITDGPTRAGVIVEGLTWLGTPWQHRQQVKGAGVDCARYLVGVFASQGLIPQLDLGYYPPDWHLHQDRPRFLEMLAQHADPLPAGEAPLPADVAMFRFGRHAAHGSIVVAWPIIIHAFRDERMVALSDAVANQRLAARLAGFWRLRSLKAGAA